MIEIIKNGERINYHNEFYSVARNGEHWIRLTDGCFRSCSKCTLALDTDYAKVKKPNKIGNLRLK